MFIYECLKVKKESGSRQEISLELLKRFHS